MMAMSCQRPDQFHTLAVLQQYGELKIGDVRTRRILSCTLVLFSTVSAVKRQCPLFLSCNLEELALMRGLIDS